MDGSHVPATARPADQRRSRTRDRGRPPATDSCSRRPPTSSQSRRVRSGSAGGPAAHRPGASRPPSAEATAMPHDVISTCPVCANELAVTRLHCRSCGTTLEGDFSVGRFGRLNRDQLTLLESFLRSRGNLREMERELGISYPTVRSRVEALVRALGFGPRADADDVDDPAGEAAVAAEDPRGDPPGPRPPRDERRRGGRRDPRAREDRIMTTTATGASLEHPHRRRGPRCRSGCATATSGSARSTADRVTHPRRRRPRPVRDVRRRARRGHVSLRSSRG